jgi:DNA-binding NtrC family response regulator
MKNIRILILDDEEGIRQEIGEFLSAMGFTIFEAADAHSAFHILDHNPVDIAILDIRLPGMSGLDALREIRKYHPSVESIMISGHGDMDSVIEALRSGACDYLKKPFLMRDVMNSIEKTRKYLVAREVLHGDQARESNPSKELWGKIGGPFIFGTSVMKRLYDQMLRVSAADSTTVLITGESGTGKELVARGIHILSQRKDKPFRSVNCSSVPEELFESEFFGYRKGAFTGAVSDKPGWFEAADGGTLFLDEIGDLKLSLQAKLLRVMDDQVVSRLGTTQPVHVDVRVVAATNHNLEALTEQQQFRADLYHRLNAFVIRIPPLRERREDIPLLVHYFVGYYASKMGRPAPVPDAGLREALQRYDYPGNVRELRHMIERAVILCDGPELTLEHFDHLLTKLREGFRPELAVAPAGYDLHQYEREAIEKALRESGNNKSKAARLLNMSRQALDRRIAKFGIR